jgi:hypothetical protein
VSATLKCPGGEICTNFHVVCLFCGEGSEVLDCFFVFGRIKFVFLNKSDIHLYRKMS